MTISVTPNPAATPPSCTVEVSAPSGSVMSAVTVYRNDHNGRNLLRTQPAAGFDSRTVTDYECPYEENVTYDWTATYSDPSAGSVVFNETWANVAGWPNALSGTWTVSAGHAQNSSTGALVQMARSVTPGHYRVTVDSLTASGPASAGLRLREQFNGVTPARYVQIAVTSSDELVVNATNLGITHTTIDPTQPFTIDFFESGFVTIIGVGDNVTLFLSGINLADLYLSATNPSSAGQVVCGPIKVQGYPAPSENSDTSDPVTLTPDDAWLIHPGSVGLSVPLAETDGNAAGIVDIASVENASNATVHKILGSATPIPTTTGPRTDDRTTMTLATVTAAESVSLRALLDPDVPLLVQVPPSWDLDFNSGFYAVGDTTVERTAEPRSPRRIVTMPLQKVQSPVVDIENTGWSYASVAVEFTAYTDLLTTFATYADLASNTRS